MKTLIAAALTAAALAGAPTAAAEKIVVFNDPHLTVNLYVTISPVTNVFIYQINNGRTNNTTTTVNVTNIITAFGGTYTNTNNYPSGTTDRRRNKPTKLIDVHNNVR